MSRWVTGLAAACLVGLSACGGPSDDERLAAWRERADGICDRTERSLRSREPATSGEDLQRLLVAAGQDVSAAAADIRDLDVPEAARPRIKPFLDGLRKLERRVAKVRRSADDAEAVKRQATQLRLDGLDLQAQAREVGLRRCGQGGQADAAADAVQMPVYASGVAAFLEDLQDGIARVQATVGPPRGSRLQRARYWEALIPVVTRARYGFDEDAPKRIDARAEALGETLFNLLDRVETMPGTLFPYRGRPYSPTRAASAQREATRLLRQAHREAIAVLEATGAAGRRYLSAAQAKGARVAAG